MWSWCVGCLWIFLSLLWKLFDIPKRILHILSISIFVFSFCRTYDSRVHTHTWQSLATFVVIHAPVSNTSPPFKVTLALSTCTAFSLSGFYFVPGIPDIHTSASALDFLCYNSSLSTFCKPIVSSRRYCKRTLFQISLLFFLFVQTFIIFFQFLKFSEIINGDVFWS